MGAPGRCGGNDQQTATRPPDSTTYDTVSMEMRAQMTYGSTMKTRDASVRLRATPPALRLTRNTSTLGFLMK